MATLIPALSACVLRMTPGERRLAERLESKLDGSYLIWYDVPVGPRCIRPDFLVVHPQRGILVLEVKDWKIDAIRRADKNVWEVLEHGPSRNTPNPVIQPRNFAQKLVDELQRDEQLVQSTGPRQGKLAFPWSYGVVLANITRVQFEAAGLGTTIEPHRVLCKDEMQDSATPQDLQSRLWDMFPYMVLGVMSRQQLDRVRWIMFNEVRVPPQGVSIEDVDAPAQLPTVMRVMDLQQELLARSLGDGHRVVHGVAGSGKTMILGYRAQHLAKAHTPQNKPILILCYNEPLAAKLAAIMHVKGFSDKVHVRHFHRWCYQQLVMHGQSLPAPSMPVDEKMQEMVERVITGVDRAQIPSGQYHSVLIDEGHDFAPHWLKLVAQMVDPNSNNLLVMYDDAQSIYKRSRTQQFSFKSVGIQAQGRTTILKINYRNTRQILQTASLIAADFLSDETNVVDGISLIQPVSSGRNGDAPRIIRLPNLRAEAFQIADLLRTAHQQGHAWGNMAVICRHIDAMDECARALTRWKMPHQVRERPGDFNPDTDSIKVLTMHASKGLEFAVVGLMGVGQMPSAEEDARDEARLFYVGATRATHRLMITASGDGEFSRRLLQ